MTEERPLPKLAPHAAGLPAVWSMVQQAGKAWVDDYASSMGAALSYYTLFSIGPVMLIVVSLAGLAFGHEVAATRIMEQLGGLMGEAGASAIGDLLKAFDKPASGVVGTVVGVVVLLVGATTVFGELQDALDRIWRAPARDEHPGWWNLVRARLLSFGMILAVGFLLIVSLVLSTALAAFGKWWSASLEGWHVAAQVADLLLGFAVTTVAFAMIYKFMPRVHIHWRDVWVGASVTALLFAIGKSLIGLYIGRSGMLSTFGAASSIVVLLVWVYYSAQIFLLGAEFTWVYAHTFGSRRDANADLPQSAHALAQAQIVR